MQEQVMYTSDFYINDDLKKKQMRNTPILYKKFNFF